MATKVHLTDTVADLDLKIAEAQVAYQNASEEYTYLKQVRALLVSPRALGIPFQIVTETDPNDPKPATYGGLKRSVFSCLSETDSKTPQAIVDIMQAQGFAFRSKTPSISVNEALQTLKAEGKAQLVGKSPTGANLWTKEKGVDEPSEDEGQEETPAEAGA